MARIEIFKKDGTRSPYFWSDQDDTDPVYKTVYKRTRDGIKRMRGVRFDPTTNRMRKDT